MTIYLRSKSAKIRTLRVMTCLMVSALPAIAGDAPSAPIPREINITSDSAPGWLPTVEQSAMAEKTARDYLAAEDAGHAKEAYDFFTVLNKSHAPFEDYKAQVEQSNAENGAVIARRFVKVTWTKDPPNAPIPGVYAAIDLASRFANADRHCGFLILYQAPSGGAFGIMREESNILNNAAAAGIARKDSPADMDAMWAKLSANCPNYPGLSPKS